MEYVTTLKDYVLGPGLVPQILLTAVAIIALYVVITMVELVVDTIRKFDRQTTVLFSDTTTGKQIIPQNPDAEGKLI